MAVEIRIDRRHARVLADLIDRLMADPAYADRSRERLLHEKNLQPGNGDGSH